ncbi:TetR/AcrR family transcriptional regulator [Actinomadura syzygii]|uniref:Helix-turn-helix transcriptional regulator n=1 Tax=Actinomadura syzygii TaxID=1427538 RepID=A0A5D0U5K8_9ACTN|nr:helix-turn-helix domain-containing protein [Actinomadura syzygii]TYC13005.1 helix-turn-helix transcriptional regulator [Actinomadura syzygii]
MAAGSTARAAAGSMRDRILAAAVEVIRARGIVAATTKEIARSAGVSEGSLYNHFANKTALFAAALGEVTGTARAAMAALLASAGQGTVEENLVRLASDMVRFYGELLPMTGPVLADPELIAWLRDDGPARARARAAHPAPPRSGQAQTDAAAKTRAGAESGQDGASPPHGAPGGPPGGPTAGPVMGHAALIGYLEAEQRAGRLSPDAAPPFLAAALLGGCQQHAFLTRLAGADAVAAGARLPAAPEEFAARLVRTVLAGHLR